MDSERRETLWRRMWAKRFAYVYLVPTFLLLVLFSYYPPMSAFYHAFTDWNGETSTWVGLKNFQFMLQDSTFHGTFRNMAIFTVFGVFTAIVPALVIAELIYNLRSRAAAYWYRMLYVLPVLVPSVVGLLIWQTLVFDPLTGLLNRAIQLVTGAPPTIDWLGDGHYALRSLLILGFPWVYGVNVLIILAGLQSMPASVTEAALLDGATGLRRVWYIDLRLIVPQIKLLGILAVIVGIQDFNRQFVMTAGGPGETTDVPGYYMYKTAFQGSQMTSGSALGYASAIGVVLFLLAFLLTYVNWRFVQSGVDQEVR